MKHQSDDSLTSISLILRVGRLPNDELAWSVFVDRYGPKILAWTRGWGLQQADAEDVTQAVLVKLSGSMSRFSYDQSRSFRGWLRTLARNAWLDWVTRQKAADRTTADGSPNSILATVEAREDLVRRLEETFDLEVMVEAVHRVQGRVAAKTWTAYQRITMEDHPVRAIADELGMTVASVFKAKSNVLKLIREEVAALELEPAGTFTPPSKRDEP